MLPDFLIIGAMKGGTTALWHYLRLHPGVFMPDVKEPNFFIDQNWRDGLGSYEKLFAGAGANCVIGEASSTYSRHPMFPEVPARIASARADIKLIYVVRDPIVRMLSHYRLWAHTGYAVPPSDQAWTFRQSSFPSVEDALLNDPTFIEWSSYALQIDRYLRHFPRSQLLIVTSEGLRAERRVTLNSIFHFLGVEPMDLGEGVEIEHNVSSTRRPTRPTIEKLRGRPTYRWFSRRLPSRVKIEIDHRTSLIRASPPHEVSISPEVRTVLIERLKPDVDRLRSHMGPDFDGWGIA
jgi:hypothetical protein